MKTSDCDDAVSPVVATILLVAIVVVLVAAVSSVVIPMVGNIGSVKSVSAAVTLNDAGTLPVVTVLGGTDSGSIETLTVYVSGTRDSVISQPRPAVGKPYSSKLPGLGAVGKQTVSIVAEFADGSIQTIYTGNLIFKGTAYPSLAE